MHLLDLLWRTLGLAVPALQNDATQRLSRFYGLSCRLLRMTFPIGHVRVKRYGKTWNTHSLLTECLFCPFSSCHTLRWTFPLHLI